MKMTKICNTCGKDVEDTSNFCPYCKGRSFRKKQEIITPDNDMVHKLFYWTYDEGAMLAKSKIAGIGMFAFLFILWVSVGYNIAYVFVLSLIFGLATFLIGLLAHKILPEPSSDKIRNNDYGLIEDMKHLLFYWQDRNGGYIPSKTKILSLAVFIIMFGVGLFTMSAPVIIGAVILGILFEIPTFLIGFAIHKLTLRDTSKHVIPEKRQKPKQVKAQKSIPEKKEIAQKKIIPQYMDYQMQLDDLNSKFRFKEKSTRELIAKRFEPPQLTYTRFIGGVDRSKEIFEKNMNSAATMINLADEYSPRIAGEIESKITVMKSIIQKLEDLSNELILNDDLSQTGDVDNLIDDMDSLINSVKDYDE